MTIFMSIRPSVYLHSIAPNFQCPSSHGPIDFYRYSSHSWILFFSHPGDFTPICTTEIGALAALQDEFNARNCKLLGLSTNDVDTHRQWLLDIHRITGSQVRFPILCDESRKVSTTYGMIDLLHFDKTGKPIPMRSVYIIDPHKRVRLVQAYPLSTGRNTAELLRCIDSLQTVDAHNGNIMTPVNWIPGDDVVLDPDLDAVSQGEKFPHSRSITNYMHLSPL